MDSTDLLRFHDSVLYWNAISDGNQSFPYVQYLRWFYGNFILHGSHFMDMYLTNLWETGDDI